MDTKLITEKMHPIERVLGIRSREGFLWHTLRMTEDSCLVWFVVFSRASYIQEKNWSYWETRSKEDTLSETFLRHRRTSQHRIISITVVYSGWKKPNNSSKRCCCLINAQRNSCSKNNNNNNVVGVLASLVKRFETK